MRGASFERGLREEVLSARGNPYTQGLLRSIPALAQRGQRLTEIPGVVPRPSNWPMDCRFCTPLPHARSSRARARPGFNAHFRHALGQLPCVELEQKS